MDIRNNKVDSLFNTTKFFYDFDNTNYLCHFMLDFYLQFYIGHIHPTSRIHRLDIKLHTYNVEALSTELL